MTCASLCFKILEISIQHYPMGAEISITLSRNFPRFQWSVYEHSTLHKPIQIYLKKNLDHYEKSRLVTQQTYSFNLDNCPTSRKKSGYGESYAE